LLGNNFWRFVLYLLFKIVIGMAIGMIVMAIICFGCCLCCIPLILISLPYIGTVSLLPLISFLRLYPVCYLRQFGDEFDVFTEPVDDIPIVYHQL